MTCKKGEGVVWSSGLWQARVKYACERAWMCVYINRAFLYSYHTNTHQRVFISVKNCTTHRILFSIFMKQKFYIFSCVYFCLLRTGGGRNSSIIWECYGSIIVSVLRFVVVQRFCTFGSKTQTEKDTTMCYLFILCRVYAWHTFLCISDT